MRSFELGAGQRLDEPSGIREMVDGFALAICFSRGASGCPETRPEDHFIRGVADHDSGDGIAILQIDIVGEVIGINGGIRRRDVAEHRGIIAATRFERSGPMWPPSPRIVWHLKQPVVSLKKTRLPCSQLPPAISGMRRLLFAAEGSVSGEAHGEASDATEGLEGADHRKVCHEIRRSIGSRVFMVSSERDQLVAVGERGFEVGVKTIRARSGGQTPRRAARYRWNGCDDSKSMTVSSRRGV